MIVIIWNVYEKSKSKWEFMKKVEVEFEMFMKSKWEFMKKVEVEFKMFMESKWEFMKKVDIEFEMFMKKVEVEFIRIWNEKY